MVKTTQRKKLLTLLFSLLISFLFFLIAANKFFSYSNLKIEQPELNIAEEIESISIVFAGDINFDRYVRKQALIKGNYNYIFDSVRELFQSSEYVVANLEGPITDNDSISMNSEIGSTSNYFFTFPIETAQVLKDQNINLVNIGNNHIHNFGIDGLDQTKRHLSTANVEYFGHVDANETNFNNESKVIEVSGYKILMLNYNQFIDTNLAQLHQFISSQDSQYDLILLYTHWGLEYNLEANTVMEELAHGFVDSGVDVIIGSHPHVVQQSEVYRGKTIYYSLGNFVFDQYFDTAVRQGLLVKLEINPNTGELVFTEYPTFIELDASVSMK